MNDIILCAVDILIFSSPGHVSGRWPGCPIPSLSPTLLLAQSQPPVTHPIRHQARRCWTRVVTSTTSRALSTRLLWRLYDLCSELLGSIYSSYWFRFTSVTGFDLLKLLVSIYLSYWFRFTKVTVFDLLKILVSIYEYVTGFDLLQLSVSSYLNYLGQFTWITISTIYLNYFFSQNPLERLWLIIYFIFLDLGN